MVVLGLEHPGEERPRQLVDPLLSHVHDTRSLFVTDLLTMLAQALSKLSQTNAQCQIADIHESGVD